MPRPLITCHTLEKLQYDVCIWTNWSNSLSDEVKYVRIYLDVLWGSHRHMT